MLVGLDDYIKLLAGLLSVVDPIGAIPLFISLTGHRSSEERQRIAWVCAISVGVTLLVALTGGSTMLKLFGISMPSFQIAGGIVISFMGVSMLKASHDRSRHTPEERAESIDKDSIAVVPMAIPLLSGPGAMSTVIVYHNLNPAWDYNLLAVSVIVTLALLVLICLLMAKRIADVLGKAGMNVITRVFGLIILSIAVEFFTKKLAELFPILSNNNLFFTA